MNNIISNSHFVGIDLGTTNSVIAFYDDTGKPKIIPNVEGEPKTPSCVYFDRDGSVLVGSAAWNMQLLEPERTLIEFKRGVGTDQRFSLPDGQTVTPQDCQTELLRYLRQSAIRYFGDDQAASKAVISVPAYFGEHERQSVKCSAERAGIQLLGLVNEPTAAGIAYGINQGQSDQLVMILDIGGGTFDVSIVLFAGGEASVLGSFGDKALGGKDVDAALMGLVLQAFEREHGFMVAQTSHPGEWFTIMEEIRRQKHQLAARTEAKIVARVDGHQVSLTVTRERLAEVIASLLGRAERVVLEALAAAKVDRKQIQMVLAVGGSSRLVCFREMITRLFGPQMINGGQVSPDLAIAEGAVIYAARLVSRGATMVDQSLQAIPAPDLRHVDVMTHSLGMIVQDNVSADRKCSVILERNTPIPAQATRRYGAVDRQQTRFHVSVVQGEEGQLARDCLVVAERELQLPPRSPSEPSIEAMMSYDASGMCSVIVKDLLTGQVEDITTDFYH
jgi:molecular chaperone DnaK (HSP70)